MKNVLFINKPKGITSFDVCYKLRKVLNTKAIGHTGTLDPNATGVMIVLFDKACKANQFLVSDSKEYIAEVEFGYMTDTLDVDGNVIERQELPVITEEAVLKVFKKYLGRSMQLPPMTSAIKVNGKKLLEYQREGKEVEIPLREIEIFSLELLKLDQKGMTFKTCVSSGTYIRALMRDILNDLNTIGTLVELTRTKVDEISIEECDDLEDVLNGHFTLHDTSSLLCQRFPSIEVKNVEDVKNGKALILNIEDERVAITHLGKVIAIYGKCNQQYRCIRGLF